MTRAGSIAIVIALSLLAASAVAGGRVLFTELDGFDCGADGCADASTPEAASTDGPIAAGASTATSWNGGTDAAVEAEAGRRPEGCGPKMIVAGTFCIDPNETTNS